MSAALTVADVLSKAADLIEPEGAWTRHAMARAADGSQRGARASDAVCFCVGGAIIRAANGAAYAADAVGVFRKTLPEGNVVDFNDYRDRTQAEVVAKLREAAAMAAALARTQPERHPS